MHPARYNSPPVPEQPPHGRVTPELLRAIAENQYGPASIPLARAFSEPQRASRFSRPLGKEQFSEAVVRALSTPFPDDLQIAYRAPVLYVESDLDFTYWFYSPNKSIRIEGSKLIRLVRNPRLQETGCIRLFEPFAAFQAIETFLGSQLAAPDTAPLRVGNDEVIARQKGFDEWSFRTQAPGAKKENRKKNRERKRGD